MPDGRSFHPDGAKRAAQAQRRHPETSHVVNLALQGGGAHGAFTWGVLDRLLEEETLAFEGITGTSAGAMNGAVLVCGLFKGGPAAAKEMLEDFWRRVSNAGVFNPVNPTPVHKALGHWNMDNSPTFVGLDLMTRLFSPYQINPLHLEPLRRILEDVVDLDCLKDCREHIKFFVAATNVRTGRVRVFGNHEITVDAVLASACLPTMFQAVEIDGDPYWDGGYTGNPSLFPLFYDCASPDIVVIQINPIYHKGTPTTAREILDRVNEISFNTALMRDMRAINFVSRLIDKGLLDPEEYKRVNVHLIEAEEEMSELGFSTKLVTDWDFLTYLRDLGRRTADDWLAANLEKVGHDSTINVRETFL